MKFKLTTDETELLKNRDIPFSAAVDYDDDSALELLDMVREAQVAYSQAEDVRGKELYFQFERIADKIYETIPSE